MFPRCRPPGNPPPRLRVKHMAPADGVEARFLSLLFSGMLCAFYTPVMELELVRKLSTPILLSLHYVPSVCSFWLRFTQTLELWSFRYAKASGHVVPAGWGFCWWLAFFVALEISLLGLLERYGTIFFPLCAFLASKRPQFQTYMRVKEERKAFSLDFPLRKEAITT